MKRLQPGVRWVAALLVVVWLVALFLLGPIVMARGDIPPPWDKVTHVLAFAFVAVAWGVAFPRPGGWLVAQAFGVAVMLGALDEGLQTVQIGRSADWADLAANVMGAALGCLALLAWAQWHGGRREHGARPIA